MSKYLCKSLCSTFRQISTSVMNIFLYEKKLFIVQMNNILHSLYNFVQKYMYFYYIKSIHTLEQNMVIQFQGCVNSKKEKKEKRKKKRYRIYNNGEFWVSNATFLFDRRLSTDYK